MPDYLGWAIAPAFPALEQGARVPVIRRLYSTI